VGEKRSPGLLKETGSNNKTDLLHLLYDFKSDEEAAAGGQPDGRDGRISADAAKACDNSGQITPPPTSASATAVRPAAECQGGSSSAASASPASKKTRGGGLKSSFVPRKLKFGAAELKSVRVRVEKLQQSPKVEPAADESDLDNCPEVPAEKEGEAPASDCSAPSEKSPVPKLIAAPGVTKEEPLDSSAPAVSDFSAVKKERRQSESIAGDIPSDVKPGRAPFRFTAIFFSVRNAVPCYPDPV
jgi:hypothetical protein